MWRKSKIVNNNTKTILPRDAILARYMLSSCVSVCPPVCLSQAGTVQKTAKRTITQTTLYDSPGTLVFQRGHPLRRRQIEVG